jgi:carboxymethylenebutenolidase
MLNSDDKRVKSMGQEIDQQAVDRKLVSAIDYLSGAVDKIAVYGCSFGGKLAMRASLLKPQQVNATAIAYCRMETEATKLSALQGPVLVVYAEQERNWPEKQQLFEQAMEEAGKQTISISYDAAHGFTNPASPRYDAAADRAAWQVVTDFIEHQIAG